MKKETTQKKAWTKPDVQDLDIYNTATGAINVAEAGAALGTAAS
jgi:hypothetical protein